jgi:hypothetical protein
MTVQRGAGIFAHVWTPPISCRRVTPAAEAGVSGHVWGLEEIIKQLK